MHPVRCPNPACDSSFVPAGSAGCPACGAASRVPPGAADTLPLTGGGADGPPSTHILGRVGRFEVRGKLGEGAFGEVFRAYDPVLDREVALKVAKPAALDTPDRVERFRREARAAANLGHPHIVRVFDSGEDGGRYFIASAFVDGRTLEAEIAAAGGRPVDLRRAADVVRKLAGALGYAHRQGVVHRDVKPANVLVDATGEPLLTDFGLAARAGDEAVRSIDGRVLGTPAYMSPEQAAGRSREVGPASDQYSLGVMLYELATGARPFHGPPELVAFLHTQALPPAPRRRNRAIPRDLEAVILKCLEKELARRYANCEDLADDLRRFLAGERVTARRPGWAERAGRWVRRNPAGAAAIALSVAVLALAGFGTTAAVLWRQTEDARSDAVDANGRLAGEKAKVEDARNQLAASREKLARVEYGRTVQVAYEGYRHSLPRSRTLLASCREDLRGWEWRYVHRLCHPDLVTMTGHTGPVHSAAFSPDGTRVVTAGEDRTVRVWDAQTGAVVHTLQRSPDRYTEFAASARFSPDGSLIVSMSMDAAVVWDARTGQQLVFRPDPRARSMSRSPSVTFSPDGRRVLIAGELWDVGAGTRGRILGAGDPSTAAWFRSGGQAFSPDGRRVVGTRVEWPQGMPPTVRGKNAPKMTAKIWDADTGAEVLTLGGPEPMVGGTGSPNMPLAYSPDGTRVVTIHSGVPKVWDARTGAEVLALGTSGRRFGVAVFSPDGELVLATTSYDSGLRLRPLVPPAVVAVVGGAAVGAAPKDGPATVTAKVWDARTGVEVLTLDVPGQGFAAAFSPDGRRLVTTGPKGTVKVWDARTGAEAFTLEGHGEVVRVVGFSLDGARIVTGSGFGSPRVWDAPTGRLLRTLGGADESVGAVPAGATRGPAGPAPRLNMTGMFSPDGARVVTAGVDGTARIWEVGAGAGAEAVAVGQGVGAAALSPDGTRVVTVQQASPPEPLSAKVWDARTGAEVLTLAGVPGDATSPGLGSIRFTPDGRQIVAVPGSGWGQRPQVLKWDARTGQPLPATVGPDVKAEHMVLSSDGTRAALKTVDGSVQMWDVRTGRSLFTLAASDKSGVRTQFSPDSSRLVTPAPDLTRKLAVGSEVRLIGFHRVWDAWTGAELFVVEDPPGSRGRHSFSPDCERFVTVNTDGSVRVWDSKSGQQLCKLDDPLLVGFQQVFTPDGRRVVTGDFSAGMVRVWDADTGVEVLALKAHTGTVTSITFSSDGERMLTTCRGGDSRARVWDATPVNRAFRKPEVAPHPRPAGR